MTNPTPNAATQPGAISKKRRKHLAEHLREHLADGRFHDDCWYCVNRWINGDGIGAPVFHWMEVVTEREGVR